MSLKGLTESGGTAKRWWPPLFLLITAVVTLAVATKSSPLYPFNNWLDSNCFMTVGKSMADGMVPYRDLYEQKGPLLYILHYFASLVSRTSFIGVFIIQVLFGWMWLSYAYKLAARYVGRQALYWMPVLSAVVYSSYSYFFGDLAEEFCLPMVTMMMYYGICAIEEHRGLKRYEAFLIGSGASVVLWIKYTMLGFYIGGAVLLIAILAMRRQSRLILSAIGYSLLGLAAGSAPILAYFAVNGAVGVLFEVYFYNNIVLYSMLDKGSREVSSLMSIIRGYAHFFRYAPHAAWMVIAGFAGMAIHAVRHRAYAVFAFLLGTLIAAEALVYAGGRHIFYYGFILCAFSVLAVIALEKLRASLVKTVKAPHLKSGICRTLTRGAAVFVLLVMTTAFTVTHAAGRKALGKRLEDQIYYRIAEIIKQGKVNPTFLNFDFLDYGFYTLCDIKPTCKFFCGLNIPLEEMKAVQRDYAAKGKVDYILTRGHAADFPKYSLRATFTDVGFRFYLYELKR